MLILPPANSLVAVGDEEGGVRLLDTAIDGKPSFSTAHLSIRPHYNAVMDLAFSSDDTILATASGDQTAHVIDMLQQKTKYVLAGHMSSVKQVRFQPGNDSILATSSRDGTVRLWDLRCRASERLARDIHVSLDPDATYDEAAPARKVAFASAFNTIVEAHAHRRPLNAAQGSAAASASHATRTASNKPDTLERSSDVSITALSFLPAGKEHLLITASEASTSIKLWDIRGKYSSSKRRGPAIPVSTTAQPDNHHKHRSFGINSLTLSGDGARLYALCRDSTIYAYSTNHLVLGTGSALAAPAGSRRPRHAHDGETGLAPIYGFRHQNFMVTSFYVKAALRRASGDMPEMLAVGSSDGCPVLFPTDEKLIPRHLTSSHEIETENDDSQPPSQLPFPSLRPLPSRTNSITTTLGSRMPSNIPVNTRGTALVRAHQKEVTGLAWTVDGALVSISDDATARCWREDARQARELRVGGEEGGRRWGCGWADLQGWDEDEEE